MISNRLYAGDSLEFSAAVPDYPPSGGWTMKIRLVPRFATPVQAPITLTAVADGDEYLFTSAPAVTATWVAGAYGWNSWVEKSGARQTLEGTQYQGETIVLPDPSAAVQGVDTRSMAQRAVDECKTALANAASRSSSAGTAGLPIAYTIGERSMQYGSADEAYTALLRLLQFWQRQVDEEKEASRLASGLRPRNRVLTRFVRPA